ncbi:alpha-tubulin binding protein [Aureococcus anophagefferens]|nr:alpha-tubulin binding protein [Aureococcus anophagefferens]
MLDQADRLAAQERQLAARLAAVVAQQDRPDDGDDDDFSAGDRPFAAATLAPSSPSSATTGASTAPSPRRALGARALRVRGPVAGACEAAGLPSVRCAVAAGQLRVAEVALGPDEIRLVPSGAEAAARAVGGGEIGDVVATVDAKARLLKRGWPKAAFEPEDFAARGKFTTPSRASRRRRAARPRRRRGPLRAALVAAPSPRARSGVRSRVPLLAREGAAPGDQRRVHGTPARVGLHDRLRQGGGRRGLTQATRDGAKAVSRGVRGFGGASSASRRPTTGLPSAPRSSPSRRCARRRAAARRRLAVDYALTALETAARMTWGVGAVRAKQLAKRAFALAFGHCRAADDGAPPAGPGGRREPRGRPRSGGPRSRLLPALLGAGSYDDALADALWARSGGDAATATDLARVGASGVDIDVVGREILSGWMNDREARRKNQLEILRRRGKGPPKKGRASGREEQRAGPRYADGPPHVHQPRDVRIYCLPENYEVVDSSLDDVVRCLRPVFGPERIGALDGTTTLARDVHGVAYLPGFCGLNNLKKTDYANVAVHAARRAAARLLPAAGELRALPGAPRAQVRRAAAQALEPDNKSVISPRRARAGDHRRVKLRFQIGETSDAADFLGDVRETLSRRTHLTKRDEADVDDTAVSAEAQGWKRDERDLPFLYLTLDVPAPLFKDTQGGNIVPQIPSSTCSRNTTASSSPTP